MATSNAEVKRWQLRLYELGMEFDNTLGGIRMYFPLMPPQDPEEMEHQQRMRVNLDRYSHLVWLFGNELHMLKDLDSIMKKYHQVNFCE